VEQLLKNIKLFSSLDEADLARLLALAVRRQYPEGEILFNLGDEGDDLYVIQKGRVKVTIPSSQGEELILAILSPPEILGEISLIDRKPRSATVQAIEETEVICFRREEFLEFLRNHFDVVLQMLRIIVSRLRSADSMVADLRFLNIRYRLVKKILELGRMFGIEEKGITTISVRVTQRDLASMIGASREMVNKQIRLLRQQKIIDQTNGLIRILDPGRLEAIRTTWR